MEDDVGLFLTKEFECCFCIDNVVQRRTTRKRGKATSQLAIDFEQRVFAAFNHHDLARPIVGNDATEFTADRTTRASDNHGAPADHGANRLFIEQPRRSADEALQVNVDLGPRTDARDEVVNGWDEPVRDPEATQARADA